MIRNISCPHCETQIKVKPELAGRTVLCPKCKGRFQIPAPELVDAEAVEEVVAPPVASIPVIQTGPSTTQPVRHAIKPVTVVALGLLAVILGLPCLCTGLLVLSGDGEIQDENGDGGGEVAGADDELFRRPLETMTDRTPYAEGWNQLLPVAEQHVAKMEPLEPGSEIWNAVKQTHQQIVQETSRRGIMAGSKDEMDRFSGMLDVLIQGAVEAEMQHYTPERKRASLTSLKRHGELDAFLAENPGMEDDARRWGLID